MTEHEAPPKGDSRWADLATAARFFTTAPIPGGHSRLADAAWAFGVIGAGVGALAGLTYAIADGLGLHHLLAAILAVAAAAVLTGALHEDGLADAADALGVRGDRECRLAAMRESGVGAYGVLALVLVTLGRVGAIAAIADPLAVLGALLAAGAVSRAALVPIMQAQSPARTDGLAAGAGQPSANGATIAVAIAAILAVIGTGPLTAIAGLIVAGLAAYGIAHLARRLLGGHTGDVLGAVQQISELVFLMAVSAIL
ncbi:MAG: adenosylcobinamide-GDP ribazoletransferase [Alphaproteobacteria bacterium]|nr:adenosylcobinamide-GDP ribazoletransferase [Alphaproteobacteria bacterium]